MRGGALPPALVCAALGLALGFAPRRIWAPALAALAAAAVSTSLIPQPFGWTDAIYVGAWITVALTASVLHLPGGVGPRLALALSLNAGLWSGALVCATGRQPDLLKALPWALLCLPAGWLVATNRAIAVKVAASWLIAVALLAAFLPVTTPTPGYAPDHMD